MYVILFLLFNCLVNPCTGCVYNPLPAGSLFCEGPSISEFPNITSDQKRNIVFIDLMNTNISTLPIFSAMEWKFIEFISAFGNKYLACSELSKQVRRGYLYIETDCEMVYFNQSSDREIASDESIGNEPFQHAMVASGEIIDIVTETILDTSVVTGESIGVVTETLQGAMVTSSISSVPFLHTTSVATNESIGVITETFLESRVATGESIDASTETFTEVVVSENIVVSTTTVPDAAVRIANKSLTREMFYDADIIIDEQIASEGINDSVHIWTMSFLILMTIFVTTVYIVMHRSDRQLKPDYMIYKNKLFKSTEDIIMRPLISYEYITTV